mgnify:CR=1 FL=1
MSAAVSVAVRAPLSTERAPMSRGSWKKSWKTKSAARSGLALLCALSLGACGSSRHAHSLESRRDALPPLVEEPRVAPASDVPEPVRPKEKAFGARYATPAQCEAAARALLPTSREGAWTALKSCVDRTHFTLLNALLGVVAGMLSLPLVSLGTRLWQALRPSASA